MSNAVHNLRGRLAGRLVVVMTTVAIIGALTSSFIAAGATNERVTPHTSVLSSVATTSLVGPGSAMAYTRGLLFVSAVKKKIPISSSAPGSYLSAYNQNGRLVWHVGYASVPTTPPAPAFLSAPGVAGGTVYVGWLREGPDQFDGYVDAYNATNGKLIFEKGQGGTAMPVVANGTVFSNWHFFCCFGLSSDGTEALNATTGTPMFTTTVGFSAPTAPPAAADGLLYVANGSILNVYDASGTHNCVAPPPPTPPYGFTSYCSPSWSAALAGGGTITGAPLLHHGVVYVTASDGSLYVYAAAGCGSSSCSALWSASTNGPITSAAEISGPNVMVGTTKGRLYAFPTSGCGASTCTPVWSSYVGGALTSTTTNATTVFVGSSNGNVNGFRNVGCTTSSCAASLVAHVHAPVVVAPLVGGNRLFVADSLHTLHVYRLP